MNKKLKVVFLGTPEFAVTILKGILESNHDVVGVVTVADKKAGRGQKIHQSAVKKYAIKENLRILQPLKLKGKTFINDLRELNADVFVVVAFRMLPEIVWKMPKLGTFNLHASLLPQYRGAAPINWSIINGETKTGNTTFFIDDKIDTGEIILQDQINIAIDETAGSLHDRLMHNGSSLVIKTLNLISKGKVETIKQPNSKELKKAYKLNNENCRIDWSDSMTNIYNKVRGLNPYPVAWTEILQDDKLLYLKIYKVRKELISHNNKINSVIIDNKEIKVSVKNGYIILEEMQLSGKKRMKTRDFINGKLLKQGCKVV